MAPSRKTAPRSKPNYLYAIGSVTLVLFALGLISLFLMQAQRIVQYYNEQVSLILEFRDGSSEQEMDRVLSDLEKDPAVLPGSVQFISKEEAAQLMRKEFGADFLALDMPNPFYHTATFHVRHSYMHTAALKALRQTWSRHSAVNDIYYHEGFLIPLAHNIRQTSLVLLSAGALALLIVSILIHNTIRLALYANRFTIKTMELVGASWGFISRPFLRRAFSHGLLSSVLAISALYGFLFWANQSLPELQLLSQKEPVLVCFASLLCLGTGIYYFSTWRVVHKYLRLRMDDLY